MATVPPYGTLDPDTMSGSNPCKLYNLVGGEWKGTSEYLDIQDPLNGENFIQMPYTNSNELEPFRNNAKSCPKTGLHNPLKNPERYVMYGEIMHQAGHELSRPETMDFFAKCIQRTMPKSYHQSWYEVKVTADFSVSHSFIDLTSICLLFITTVNSSKIYLAMFSAVGFTSLNGIKSFRK